MSGLLEQIRASRLPPPEECRRIRRAAHVSLAEVGAELGVTDATVCRWESGKATPRRSHAVAYRRLLEQLQEATS